MLAVTFAFARVLGLVPSPSETPSASSPIEAGWFAAGGIALVAVVCSIWAWLERKERRALLLQNSELSLACRNLTEHHYRERVQAEERHLLAHDSSVRNILEHLERTLLGKPKP